MDSAIGERNVVESDRLLGARTPLRARGDPVPSAWNGWDPEARYFVRYGDGRYENRRLRDDTLASQPPLVAVRTMITSPFDAHEGLVIYAGGFDANHVTANDTGWLCRGTLQLSD